LIKKPGIVDKGIRLWRKHFFIIENDGGGYEEDIAVKEVSTEMRPQNHDDVTDSRSRLLVSL